MEFSIFFLTLPLVNLVDTYNTIVTIPQYTKYIHNRVDQSGENFPKSILTIFSGWEKELLFENFPLTDPP